MPVDVFELEICIWIEIWKIYVFVFEFDLAELHLYLYLFPKYVFEPNPGTINYIS